MKFALATSLKTFGPLIAAAVLVTACAGEQCDDSNQIDTDSCRNSGANAACGDGVVQTGVEDCDDGNQNNNDECTNACHVKNAATALPNPAKNVKTAIWTTMTCA